MEKMKMESANLAEQNIDRIAALFPNVITEAKDNNGKLKRAINFDLLRQMLSEDVVEGDECYDFTWVGKKQSIIEGNRPIRKTLRPCPEESKDWEKTGNLYIEGDNLDVLKLLQGSYQNTIKMIYIDPPYNTGNDFVYRDNFAVSKEDYEEDLGLFDEDENRLFKNNESNGRYHSDWCSMLYPRLQLARNLLKDDGVIFISIDDNEVDNLRKIGDEVFGEDNFIGQWNWFKSATPPNLSKKIKKNIEYILCYERKKTNIKYKGLQKTSVSNNGLMNQTNKFATLVFPSNIVQTNMVEGIYRKGKYGTDSYEINLLNDAVVKNGVFTSEIKLEGKFKWGQDNLLKEISNGTIISIKTSSFSPSYEKSEYDPEVPPNLIDKNVSVDTTENAGKKLSELFDGIKVFDYPKPVNLIMYLSRFVCEKYDTILDFFSGSATTANAVMQLNSEDGGNRKFIMVQLPELCDEKSEAFKAGYKNICEIGKERISRAGKKIKEEAGLNGQSLDTGFRVLKLDSTNMKEVYYSPADYSQQLLLNMESNIKEDRSDLDLLYGIMTEWCLPLSLSHVTEIIEGIKVHFVNDNDLVACFDENISEIVVKDIAHRKPTRVVFRDNSFANSPDKINVSEIFKVISPETTIKVI
ncbi:MAG: site-specific DNA-methyltransferase [Bacteroidales bacterium]|nr:site-specific DNA-methyltransferase [Bacteroidales bacterium]